MSAVRSARRTLRVSLVAGIAVALALLVSGLVLAALSETEWTAESVAVVLPDAKLDEAASAAYYETLSRGQIVATFAEVAGNQRFEQRAEEDLELTAEQAEAVTTEVTVAPSTSVILIRATGEDKLVTERLATAMVTVSADYLGSLSKPYRFEPVNADELEAFTSGTPPYVVAAAAVVVALVGGLAVQQAIFHSLLALRGGRTPAAKPLDGTEPPAAGPADRRRGQQPVQGRASWAWWN